MDLRILFENADMVAVEKPQGMPVSRTEQGMGICFPCCQPR
ncbi:MAG: hypothetical protein V8Q36_04020 [Anaerotignum sp.]